MVIRFSCSSSTKLTWILALLLMLVTMIQVHGQSPPGFVNIDCGWRNSDTYIDDTLGIQYSFDDEFVKGGVSYVILLQFRSGAGNEQQKTPRSFPDGLRNCYTLPSTVGGELDKYGSNTHSMEGGAHHCPEQLSVRLLDKLWFRDSLHIFVGAEATTRYDVPFCQYFCVSWLLSTVQIWQRHRLYHKKGDTYFTLNKTPSSSLPPLINAFEVYSLVPMENLASDYNDEP